jgi:DNA-binding NtrC family response regulator
MMAEPKIPLLVVDDEESIHRALERTLRWEPFEILHAYDAGEADAILGQRPDVRAVICDHYMPGTPGLEWLLHVRRTRPKTIAILLTAQADLQMVLTALNEGRLHRFFTKPWDGDELRSALRRLLKVERTGADRRREKVEATEARLRRTSVPRQDADGAWVIEAPEGEAGAGSDGSEGAGPTA